MPFTQFALDLQANRLPNFVWITPNMCNDMRDCPISAGHAWLKEWTPQILASPAWQDRGLLLITFVEGELNDISGCCGNANGGRIATLIISPLSRPGFASDVAYTHYSLLRTIEAAWKLPLLGHANCDCTLPMADFFLQSNAQP